ncbi:MAG TPA: MarR family winged helix-turn-helix transcriptional regulator [Polyangiaceae bacterium]|nr:MarR family winged helix-turn-helix transcriptional regulator [Polyangiaceae bacterium]
MTKVSASDYRALAAFRYEIRKFLAFSEVAARAAQIEPQQHQLLLAVQGLPPDQRPTIRAISERLCVRHHTTVALVDKLEFHGLLQRERSQQDRREVLLRLTPQGSAKLLALSILHKDQLRAVGAHMLTALGEILGELEPSTPRSKPQAPRAKSKLAKADTNGGSAAPRSPRGRESKSSALLTKGSNGKRPSGRSKAPA